MIKKTTSKRKKIVIITEERSDAIGIYNDNIIRSLKKITQIRNIHLKCHPFQNRLLNYFIEIISTFQLLGRIRREEVILLTDPVAFKANIAFFAGNEKYVIFHHIDEHRPAYIRLLPFLSYQKLLSRFDAIIADSEFSRHQLLELNIPIQKITIIPCGIDHTIFRKSESRIKETQGDYLIAVNNETPRKNMKSIFKAFSSIKKLYPSLKLVKIGHASTADRQKTLYLMSKYDIAKDVILMEKIESKKLAAYYSGARAMIFPSLREGFGLPIIEAMACGCPVITSNISPMKEIATDKQILVDPENLSEIIIGIDRVLRDEEFAKMLSIEGMKRAKEFNWETTARKIMEIING